MNQPSQSSFCRAVAVVGLAFSLFASPAAAQTDDELMKIDPPADLQVPEAPVLSDEAALKSFTIVDGFEIQLVAGMDLLSDPVCMAWDDHGRIWVAEMDGYMRTLDAQGETDPSGKIVILEDTDGDGQMDKRTVWLDKIVLPRAIAFAGGGVLFADTTTLWFVALNEDGSPGAKMAIDHKYANDGGEAGNVEHQANGLLYGLDNWYYSAKSSRRYQQRGGKFFQDKTEFRGQWGITQDDDGRLLANRNGVLVEYHVYPPSATLRNPNYNFKIAQGIVRSDNTVFPIRVTPGTNRAYRPDQDVSHTTWKLQRATANCGPVIYRGTQFPDEYYGNLFIPEPAGHLVKRMIITDDGQAKPSADHAYADKEFLASTDERSRIVNAYTGPDGALYLIDFYRGVIQHKHYLTDYLKRQAVSRDLHKHIGMGRIYRVVHKDSPIENKPFKLAGLSNAQLVQLLKHKNAWQRHSAQRLLVQKNDSDVVPSLEVMATLDPNPQARIHALWTLQGMDKLSAATLYKAGESADPRVRTQVVRLAEKFEGKTEAVLFVELMQSYSNADPTWGLDLQLAFSAGILASIDAPEAYDVLVDVLARRGSDKLVRSAIISGLRGKEAVMLAKVGKGPIKGDLTRALVKATENGDLTIDSLLALVDAPDFKNSRTDLLASLSTQAVDGQRHDVIDKLIEKVIAQDAASEDQVAILSAMTKATKADGNPIELDGKPEVFEQWSTDAPEHLAAFIEAFDQTFVYEREVLTAEMKRRLARGQMHYMAHCSTCHAADGSGVEKAAPPLYDSDWVRKHPKVLTKLILNGIEGDIVVNGQLYTAPDHTPGLMPGLKSAITSDQDVADILTFIRSREFKNNKDGAGPVDVETVAEIRQATASRAGAHSVNELVVLNANLMGIELVSASNSSVVVPTWLKSSYSVGRNLVLVILGVTVLLGILLFLTVFGAMTKPDDA